MTTYLENLPAATARLARLSPAMLYDFVIEDRDTGEVLEELQKVTEAVAYEAGRRAAVSRNVLVRAI